MTIGDIVLVKKTGGKSGSIGDPGPERLSVLPATWVDSGGSKTRPGADPAFVRNHPSVRRQKLPRAPNVSCRAGTTATTEVHFDRRGPEGQAVTAAGR
jgi:hypothetical protein